ncbi:hypothetical protein J7438_10900 [Thalassotalea sp. G20_0]|uniref:hypothetical protein n=1 Tax=Thalassotalea sp. G20_0 TaxID=2821093 RepID=UPI001ADCB041|nr:hypothetical protein [Thalassotalea sp. G20_0]MBO9494594.1 hypothetical protein [Thalassotalea sp. G20_0]
MNSQECSVPAAINIDSWKNSMSDNLLINGVGEFKGDEKKVTFYSVEAKRYYDVSVCGSDYKSTFVNIIVTARTDRKNIFNRMIGAVADAFKRLVTSGMKFSKTRSSQIKDKLEPVILDKAIDKGKRRGADRKTIENGFKAATQRYIKFNIDDIDNDSRFILAKSLFDIYDDPSLLHKLQWDLNAIMRSLQQDAASLSASAGFHQDQIAFNSVDGVINLTDYALTGNNNARQRVDHAGDMIRINLWRQNHYNSKLVKTYNTIHLVGEMLTRIQHTIDSKQSRKPVPGLQP